MILVKVIVLAAIAGYLGYAWHVIVKAVRQ